MESAARVTQSAKRDEDKEEPRTGQLSSKSHKLASVPSIKDVDMPPAQRDRTSIPNYVVGILVSILMVLLGFVAQNFYWKGGVDKEAEWYKQENMKLWQKVETQDLKQQKLERALSKAGIDPDTGEKLNRKDNK